MLGTAGLEGHILPDPRSVRGAACSKLFVKNGFIQQPNGADSEDRGASF